MTAIENLRATKMLLEHQLKEGPSAEEREWIEGELMKVDIALRLLDTHPDSTSQKTLIRISIPRIFSLPLRTSD